MNKERRKQLEDIILILSDLKADLESVLDEEQDYYDNMPENFQNGEKGEMASSAIDNLENAISDLETAIENAQEAAS